MTQERVYNFGDLLTQGRARSLAARLFPPGLYSGFAPTLLGQTAVRLSPGTLLTPNGVMVTETTAVEVPVPPPEEGEALPVDAASYTLIADHTDIQTIGGSTASYSWVDGLVARSGAPDVNSVAVLYCRYDPAAAAGALTAAMFSSPPSPSMGLATEQWGHIPAPFAQACDVDLSGGPNIAITPASHPDGAQHLGWAITNSAGFNVQQVSFKLPLPLVPRARYVDVYADLSPGASIDVTALDSDGDAVALSPATITGPDVGLDEPVATLAVASTTLNAVTLAFEVNVPALSTGVFIKALRVRGD